MRPREPVAQRRLAELAAIEQALGESFTTSLDQLGDLLAAEAELAGAGLDLFAPGVGVDAVLLALSSRERRRLAARLRAQTDPTLPGRAQHLVTTLRELDQDLRRNADELGGAVANLPPLQAESVADQRRAGAPDRDSPPSSPPDTTASRAAP